MPLREKTHRRPTHRVAHARGRVRSCMLGANDHASRVPHRVKPTCIDKSRTRLGSCSRDPIGYEGSPWNLKEYVGGQPTSFLDPYGFQLSYPIGVGQAVTAGWTAQEIAQTFGLPLAVAAALVEAKQFEDAVDKLTDNIEKQAKGKDKCDKAKNAVKQAQKSIEAAQKLIDEHQGYIDDPTSYPGDIQISCENAIEAWKKHKKKHEDNKKKYEKVKEKLEQKVRKECPQDIPWIPFF